ncbi:uncharacterized protein ColSpa_06512 [Colletotrichum spaethianum]|uniref:Uncharacterized protein n=1 Tax=Colletotrichum spaethianum TaxID=700344 RepID=A0AA37LCX5_9PEZI|nr:uncharacterized protein ColSpa_06512 [Colletotrichum spaethianum]GKT46331.1 hypothetical protein ColSpa_06512 [Colletotrichum spaethianum]
MHVSSLRQAATLGMTFYVAATVAAPVALPAADNVDEAAGIVEAPDDFVAARNEPTYLRGDTDNEVQQGQTPDKRGIDDDIGKLFNKGISGTGDIKGSGSFNEKNGQFKGDIKGNIDGGKLGKVKGEIKGDGSVNEKGAKVKGDIKGSVDGGKAGKANGEIKGGGSVNGKGGKVKGEVKGNVNGGKGGGSKTGDIKTGSGNKGGNKGSKKGGK